MSKQRQVSRIQERAEKTLSRFVETYIDLVANPEVNDEELKNSLARLDNRWKTFCHIQGFEKKAFSAFSETIERMNKPEEAPKEEAASEIVDKM